MHLYQKIKRIAEIEFSDIVDFSEIVSYKLHIFLKDSSFADIWFSQKIEGRYSYHWERQNEIFRHDNMPHLCWKEIPTFPKHFHNQRQDCVETSALSDDPEVAIREFLNFIRSKTAVM